MTKVKIASKSVGGSANATKKKGSNATSSLASNVKMKKNHTNAKGEKLNVTQSNYVDNYLEIQSKVRLCFVNIKRDSSLLCNSSDVVRVNDGSRSKQLTTTLQDQYTDGMARNEHSQITLEPTSVAQNDSITAETNVSAASRQEFSNKHNEAKSDGNKTTTLYKDNKIQQRSCADEGESTTLKNTNGSRKDDAFKTQFVIRKCVVKLQKMPKSSQTEEIYNRNAAKDALLASQIISPTLDHEKRIAFRKLSLSMHHNPKDNDGKSGKQSSIESNESTTSHESTTSQKSTSLQLQRPAVTSANKSTNGTRKCQPERSSISSKRATTGPKMEQEKQNHIVNKTQNQFPTSCRAKLMFSDKNLKKQFINTSSSGDKENQTKRTTPRYEIRKHGQLSNALQTNNNILASDKITSKANNGLKGLPLANKVQNSSLSRDIKAHRNTTLSNVNKLQLKQKSKLDSEIASNPNLPAAQINKNNTDSECQKLPQTENRIGNTPKDKQMDKVLDNCIANEFSEKLIEKEPMNASCGGDKEKAVKTGKKCLRSENTILMRASTSTSRDFQTLSTSKVDSKRGNEREKDATNNKCIKLPDSSRTRQDTCSSENRSEIEHLLPQVNSTMGPDGTNKNNVEEKENHDKLETAASKNQPSVSKDPNAKLPTLRSVNNNINTSTILDFQPQRNSTMHFEHPDSNVIETGAVVSDSISHSFSATENHTKATNKTNKFFHRHETETSQITVMASTKHMAFTNTKNYRFLTKRSSQFRREQVYDFLSQSQTSDSRGGTKNDKPTDPTADIIKKLIAEGKVAVATCKKGKGKPVLKRNYKKKPKKAIPNKKVVKDKNIITADNKSPSKHQTENLKTPLVVEHEAEQFVDDHFMDNDDDAPTFVGEYYNFQKPSTVEPARKGLSRNHDADQEGTFSNLARSVLINQAGRNDAQRLKAQRLLSMAKSLISTPKSKNTPSIRTTINNEFSPIPLITQKRPATKPSPWRVDEDAHLPRVFNFSRSSGNLPSFSSDFIPPTPRKDKLNRSNKSKLAETGVQQVHFESSPLPLMEGIAAIPNQCSTPLANYDVNSSIPSFSSYDSNAENKTPPGQGEPVNDENANIFNLKQFANPRKALNYRSPLKVINITEVVRLPPLEMSKVANYKEKPQIATISNTKDSSEIERYKSANIPKEDLFGFEDFLSQTEHSSQEFEPQAEINVPTSKEPTNTINEKRHGLRKLKPDTTELQICLQRTAVAATDKKHEKNKHLFIDAQFVSKPQKSVKEMLCSTMCHEKPTTSRKALEEQRNRAHCRIEEESNISGMLFRDIEPETTFNEEDPHHTYIRPHKRRRRLKEDRLIYAFESEESDNEGNDSAEKKKSANNQSRETDTSSEKQPPTKKKKRQRKENPELIHFVDDFNKMCKEVDNYKLIVEKSV